MNLNKRIDELRQLYLQTKDEVWMHRYNECMYIKEHFLIEKFDKQVNDKPKYNPLEHQNV